MVAQPCLQNVRPIPEVLSYSMVSVQCAECPRLLRGAAQKTLGLKHDAMFHSNEMGQATYICFKIHFLDMFSRGPKHYLELASHTKQHPVP